MRKQPYVMSIFAEIDAVVAKQMMAEGKGVGLLYPTQAVPSLDDLPPTTRRNERGDPARMVIVMPRHLKSEFERRIEKL